MRYIILFCFKPYRGGVMGGVLSNDLEKQKDKIIQSQWGTGKLHLK